MNQFKLVKIVLFVVAHWCLEMVNMAHFPHYLEKRKQNNHLLLVPQLRVLRLHTVYG